MHSSLAPAPTLPYPPPRTNPTHTPPRDFLHFCRRCCRYVSKVDTLGYVYKLTNADTISSNATAVVPGTLGVNTTNVFRSSLFLSLYGTKLYSVKGTSLFQLC